MTTHLLITPVSRVQDAARTLHKTAMATLAVLLLLPLLQVAATTAESLAGELLTDQVATVADRGAAETTGAATLAPLTYSGPGWAAITDGSGVTVATAGDAFDLRTAAIAGVPVADVTPTRDGDLLTFDHGIATEWWRTVDNGLEQGWTFDVAPATASTTLTVDVNIAGSFTPVAESDTVVRLMSDSQTLWYRDLVSWDATGRDLPSVMSVVGDQIRISVDATGAVYPVTVDPILTEDQKLTPPPTNNNNLTGSAVDVDGPNSIYSVPGRDVFGPDSGGVIFGRNDGAGWTYSEFFDGELGDDSNFGAAVGVASDTINLGDRAIALVGAPDADVNGENSGAVSVYTYDPTPPVSGWQFVTQIFACDVPSPGCDVKDALAAPDTPGAQFGASIDLQYIGGSSWLAVIGAPGTSEVHIIDFDMTLSGRTLPNFTADLREIITSPVADFGVDVEARWGPDDVFSTTMAEQFIVVGVGDGGDNDGSNNAAAYVYQRQGTLASPTPSILIETIAGFGTATGFCPADGLGDGQVAVANDLLVVADGVRCDGEIRAYTGAFDGSPGVASPWSLIGNNLNQLGTSLDIADVDGDQTVIAMGSPGQSGGGAAYLYEITQSDPGGSTFLLPELATSSAESARIGTSIATDGVNWIIGDPTREQSAFLREGQALIGTVHDPAIAPVNLALDDGNATPIPDLLAPERDRFGSSIDIDGDRMVVGAPDRDSTFAGGGEVFIYERAGGVWGLTETLQPPTGDFVFEGFGTAVAVGGDFIAVGVESAILFGNPVDWVFVYEKVGAQWLDVSPGLGSGLPTNFGESLAIADHPVDGPTVYAGGSDDVPADAVDGLVQAFVLDTGAAFTTFVLKSVVTGSDSFGASIDAAVNGDDSTVVLAIGAPDETANGTIFRYVDFASNGFQLDGSYTRPPLTGPERIGLTVAVDPLTFNLATVSPTTGELTLLKDGDPGSIADVALVESQTAFSISGVDPSFDSFVDDSASGFVASLGNTVLAPALTINVGEEVSAFAPDGGGWVAVDDFIMTAPTNGDQLGWETQWTTDGTVVLSAPGDDESVDNSGADVGAVYVYNNYLPPDEPTLNFSFDLAPGSAPTVDVAPSGIAAADFDAATVEAAAESETSVAASPLGAIDLEDAPLGAIDVEGSPLGAIAFGDPTLDLAAIILADPDLAGLPLVDVGIADGWEAIIAGTPLAAQPINNLTLGDVLGNAAAAGQLAAAPLGAIEINGTPLGAIPLGAIALGATPLGAIPLGAIGFGSEAELCAALGIPAGSCATELDNTTALEASIQGAPLGAIPLGAIPLGAIDLADTPLGAIPLGAIDLAQSPLGAIPLGAIPLGAIELDASPLGAIPLGAIPLGAIPLGAIDPAGTPLGAIPLGAITVDGAPLGAIPLGAIAPNGTPLGAIPTAAPLGAIPLGAIDVVDSPLGAIPLGAIALADVPLGAIPLGAIAPNTPQNDAAWCELLADIDAGYDCTNGGVDADTTVFDLMVQGVPLGAIPLGAIPLGAIEIAGSPLGAIPLGAIALEDAPLGAIPLGAIPLGAIDLTGTPLGAIPTVGSPVGVPLGAIPLGGIDITGSPLGAIPLGAIDLAASPLGAIPLGAIPLGAIPLGAIPLGAIEVSGAPLGAIPLGAIDITGSPLGAIPLGAITVDGTPLGAIPLGAIDCTLVDCDADTLADAITAGAADGLLLEDFGVLDGLISGLSIGEIVAAVGAVDADITFAATHDTLGEIDPTEMVLGDIPAETPELELTALEEIEAGLYAVTFADLVSALRVAEADAQAALAAAFAALGLTLDDFEVLGDVTLDDLLAGTDGGFTLQELGRIVGLIHVQDVLTAFDPDAQLLPGRDLDAFELKDLTVDQLGDLTLFDLIDLVDFDQITLTELFEALTLAGVLDGYTFSDLLVALVAADELPFEGLDFTEVAVADLPAGTVAAVPFRAEIQITDSIVDHVVEMTVDLPGTASYVAGSASVGDPEITGNRLTWLLTEVPPATMTDVSFEIRPTVSLGVTELDASARIVGFDGVRGGVASVAVAEGIEPNDFPAVTTAAENTIYLTYITSRDDNDVFAIDVSDNDQLAVSLTSLTADLDVALYVQPDDVSATQPLADVSQEAPLVPITDPDQEAADTEPLQDFRRLDLEDSALELLEVSNSPGTESELIVTDRLIAGTYYLQVFGANGATTVEPAALQVQILEAETAPDCVAQGVPAVRAAASPAIAPAPGPNTAILVNYQRYEELYDAPTRALLESELNAFVSFVNADPTLGVDATVIPVDGFAAVRDAYDAWDAPVVTDDACSPVTANDVVNAIIDAAIDPMRSTLEHVVIVGGDQMIPMARLADQTTVANEYDFRHEFDDDAVSGPDTMNALTATFWERTYLSDEPYGESSARDLGDRYLYVSDLALGRLVETPEQIVGQLQHFQNFNGQLNIETGQVLGYDFLSDGSAEISADLQAGLGAAQVDDDLADGEISPGTPWTQTEAIQALTAEAGAPADIISLNAHFDHYRALPADEGTLLETGDPELDPDSVLGGILVDIVFSMGCHGGLNVSDIQVANTNQDWAQTFADSQTVFIGNTGFGYGDTETVAYTERLLALFAEEVVRPFGAGADKTTIGQALTYAKNRYVSDLSTFSVYDEKAVMEATFYGLPFYTVGIAGQPLPPAPTNSTSPDATGLETLGETITGNNDPQVTAIGTYYSNPDTDGGDEQVISVPGYPVQPSLSTDISVVEEPDTSALSQVAHGAIVTGMSSQYLPGTDPVVAAAIFDEVAAAQGEPELGDVVFPAKPVTINTATTPSGERQTLVTATGQFASAGLTQRLDSEMDVVVYYSDPADSDFIPPQIGAVESTLEGSQFTVSLDVTDDQGAIERVLVLVVEDPGSGNRDWIPVELQQIGGTNQWSGSSTVTATEVEFLVQAVDGSGNVGFATNKARNFNDDVTPEPEPPTPDLDAVESPVNLDAATGWYTGDASIDVSVTSSSAEFSVDGSAYAPLPGSSFPITGDGIHTWSVRLASGTQEIDGIVRIDTTGAPEIEIAPPADGATYDEDAVPTLSYLCSDPSLDGQCSVTINGAPAALGDPLPTGTGVTHEVTVSGVDVFGNQNSVTHTYTVTPVVSGNPPVIVDAMVENIAVTGDVTDITVEFTGDPGVSASIDWGDGTVTNGTVTDPTGTSPGIVDGDHAYAAGGVYTITVTLTGPGGATASIQLVTASCTKVGTPGNDWITGTTGNDVLCGLGGADQIFGLAGDDIIYGGTGRDRLFGNSGKDVIYGGRDRDLIYGGGQDDRLIGGLGNDYLNGQSGDDVLLGRAGPDVLIGGYGDDKMYGQRGDDYITGQRDDDFARGGAGNDRIYGSGGNDELRGGAGDDIISGGGNNDDLDGGDGNDRIYGTSGMDTINGGAGDDLIYGGGSDDDLRGGSGDDAIYGQSGNDDINGGVDQDLCRGGSGADNLTNCEL